MKSTRTLSLAAACLCCLLTFSQEATADQVIPVKAGRGNINVYYPDSYDPSEPLPLLIHCRFCTGTPASSFTFSSLSPWLLTN